MSDVQELILSINQLAESFENSSKSKNKETAEKGEGFTEGFKSKQRTTEAIVALIGTGQVAAALGAMTRTLLTELLNSVKAEFKESYKSRQEASLEATKNIADEMARAGITPSREFLSKYLDDRHSMEVRALEGRRQAKEVGGILPDWYYKYTGEGFDWLVETMRDTKQKLNTHQPIHAAYKLHGD